MKRNQKSFDQWTKWDWFVDDVKNYATNPLFILIAIVSLITVAIITILVIAIINGVPTNNSSFWTLFNTNTVLRNSNILH